MPVRRSDHSSQSPPLDSVLPVSLLEVGELKGMGKEERLEHDRALENELIPSYLLTKALLMLSKGSLTRCSVSEGWNGSPELAS